jgi:uncharacterized UBP type Zn finger protein
MMAEFFFGETPMPKPIKDSSGEKGLLNYLGENNCFLNVVIQSLWHLEAFRQKFTSEKELHKHQEHCVYCSLEVRLYSSKCAITTIRLSLPNTLLVRNPDYLPRFFVKRWRSYFDLL